MVEKGQYVYGWPRPMVTTDAIVFCTGKTTDSVLMIKRGREPNKGMWAFPGGFLELDEKMIDSAKRELQEETGLSGVELEQMQTFGDIGRDPRGRLLTVTFIGFVDEELEVKGGDDADEARWFDINDLPENIAFDHNMIIHIAIEKLKQRQNGFASIDSLNWAYRTSRVLQIANRIGVFDALSEKPLSADELADKCKAANELAEKLLIACTALRLVTQKDGKYQNSKLADKYLVIGADLYQGNMIAHSTWVRGMWDQIENNLSLEPLEDIETQQHYNFIMAMDNIAKAARGKIFLENIDLSDRKKLLDVGGGPGSYSIAACKKWHQLNATIFDMKETIEIAKEVIAGEGLSDRITTVTGSWDTDEFGAGFDAAIMSNIMHGKNDDALMKLKKAYNALEPGGLLAVQEFLLNDEKDGPVIAALFNMMVGAFSQSELLDVITQAGFADAKIVSVNETIGSGWVTAQKPS